MKAVQRLYLVLLWVLLPMLIMSGHCSALSSPNIPLDSPVYGYIEKLAGFGLLSTDFRGIRPYTRSEAARLLAEARTNTRPETDYPLVQLLFVELDRYLAREVLLREQPDKAPLLDWTPLYNARLRYLFLDGVPRSYERQVHDPGGDGVFGIGAGLRPDNPYPSPVQQHGTEGTPMLENNEGNRYDDGSNGEIRFSSEGYLGSQVSIAIEPLLVYRKESASAALRFNKGYLKLGGGALELEAGRDANWLGPGYRGAITLTDNARNFDLLKLSSPEPIDLGFLGEFKYALLASRFEKTNIGGVVRQPWFYAMKLSCKPGFDWEIGFNLGRQVGGTGVNNGLGDTLRGIVGGTNADNSNGLAGLELRYRSTWLRNTEFYGEFSGEDTAAFWPIVESYLAGIFIPNLTNDGRNDLRFEFFQGNQILYTHSTFPQGYLYRGMPIGHSQGGATQELFFRYSHWFSVRNTLALEYFYTRRGVVGKMPGQTVEQKDALRGFWRLPVYGNWDTELMYGWEHINNINLVAGAEQTNQIVKVDLSYRY